MNPIQSWGLGVFYLLLLMKMLRMLIRERCNNLPLEGWGLIKVERSKICH